MHDLHYILLAINMVNVIVLAMLLFIYSRNYRHIKSKYNLGLLVFSLLFLVENIIIIHLGIFTWPLILDDIMMLHMIFINSIELVGFSVLLLITWK